MSDSESNDGLPEARDPEDYITQRRLQDIYDARQDLLSTRQQAAKLEIEAENARRPSQYRENAVKLHRSAIENYLLELQPLFENFDTSGLWDEQYYGSITVEPPEYELNPTPPRVVGDSYKMDYNGQSIIVEPPLPEPEIIDIVGVNTLFAQPSPLKLPFEFNVRRAGNIHRLGNDTISETTQFYINKPILDNMLTAVNNFMADHGLELDPADANDEWEIQV